MSYVRVILLAAIATVVGLVAPLSAQAQTVEVRARPGAEVYVITDKGRVLLGTLNKDGQLEIPENLVDEDDELEVVLESSATAINVALVERGREDPVCAPDAPTGITCTRTGTFVRWGRVDRIVISPAGQVTVEADEDGGGWGVGLIIDVDGAYAMVSNDDRLCDEASRLVGTVFTFTCDTESATDAFGAAAGVTFLRLVALKAGYLDVGQLDFSLNGTVAGETVTVTGRVGRTRGPTFTGALRLDFDWPVVPFVEAGVWRWSTDLTADVSLTGPTPVETSTRRSLNGWDPIIAAGVEFWPARNVGLHAGIRWVSVEEELPDLDGLLDLDNQYRLFFFGLKIGVR